MQIHFVASLQRQERLSQVIQAVVQLSLQPSFPGALKEAITRQAEAKERAEALALAEKHEALQVKSSLSQTSGITSNWIAILTR